MTTLPRYQCSSGRVPNSPQRTGRCCATISITAGCQPLNAATASPGSIEFQPLVGMRPDLRVLDYGEEVHVLGVAADCIMQQVGVRSHPELDRLGIGQRRQLRHGHDAAECTRPRVDRVVPTGDEAADERAHAVRANNEIRLNGSPIGEAQTCSATEVPDLGQPMIEMQPGATQRTAQDALEVRAMDPVVGRTANPLVTHVLMNRMRRDAAAVPPASVDQLAWLGRDGCERVEHAEST